MKRTYYIGGYDFRATSLIDATVFAIHRARTLFGAGETAEAKRLYAEAWRIRDEIRDSVRNQLPFPTYHRVLRRSEAPIGMRM